jgi:hypothetical protein
MHKFKLEVKIVKTAAMINLFVNIHSSSLTVGGSLLTNAQYSIQHDTKENNINTLAPITYL